MEKQEKLRKAAQSLVEYIRAEETPMTTVIVTGAGVEVLSTERHVPFDGSLGKGINDPKLYKMYLRKPTE